MSWIPIPQSLSFEKNMANNNVGNSIRTNDNRAVVQTLVSSFLLHIMNNIELFEFYSYSLVDLPS